MRYCCHIEPTTGARCHKTADFEVVPNGKDLGTDACADHIGHLLSGGESIVRGIESPTNAGMPPGPHFGGGRVIDQCAGGTISGTPG